MQRKATKIVANIPTTRPASLKASGIANIPVPREALRRWVSVSQSLKKIKQIKKLIKTLARL